MKAMKWCRFSLIALCLCGLTFTILPVHAQTPVFLSVIEDLPLMPGFVEDSDSALKFETEAGRIAEITASGAGTISAVIDFYSRTLPQLGWRLETPTRYRREGEILILDVLQLDSKGAGVEVHFLLSPATAK